MAMLNCRGVGVTLGSKTILDGIDLVVERGQWVCVVGPNGAGKSTLLRHLAGLVAGTGTVSFQGRPAAQLTRRERAKSVALVPQAPVIPDGITVLDYVLLGRWSHIHPLGVESGRDLAAVQDALDQLDLTAMAGRVVTTLSGGERQRVVLARALCQAAPLLLLDEPTTALDVGHQQQVLELIESLQSERGLTVLSTMHDLTLAGQYADRLLLLDSGRTVIEGLAAEVLTETNLSRYYGARVQIIYSDGRPVVLPMREQRRARG